MSTSIAALPAYKTSKATRTKARADRTIFGTTLDNSTKAVEVLRDEKARSAAEQLFVDRHKKWETPPASRQALLDAAWGIKNYLQPEIGEEYSESYSRVSSRNSLRSGSVELDLPGHTNRGSDQPLLKNKISPKPDTPLVAFKDRFGVYNVLKENVSVQETENLPNNSKAGIALQRRLPPRQTLKPLSERRRRASGMSSQLPTSRSAKQAKWSKTGQNVRGAVQVPKFPLPPGGRNYMRTASLKITETGAKDLINAGSINKVGLGQTQQYNHEAFKKRETPNQYRDHGNVFSLGQRGNTTTTNEEVTGPGGFYKMSTPERGPNDKHSDKSDVASVYSLPYEPSVASRRTYDAARSKRPTQKPPETTVATPSELSDVIPLNIIHKYGAEEVRNLLKGSEHEVKIALQEARNSDLTHSGMVPPRIGVPELNHPIDPSPTYHSNFGQSLKYDKFDGGLHLYIN